MDDIANETKIRSAAAEISQDERIRRKAAVDYARGSVRLEGFVLPPALEELNRRYIDGEIGSKELTAAILAHYKP